ncbi:MULTISPECIES: glycosyltransferase family 2 protein [Ensifer]|uniref:glycosyltransferase family 2 protein n=1 Tax=Ensifer TaxID=106591 RepID=UPI000DC4769F|nr:MULTISPECIES: glycosyltransferase family 2 protein [Ensifer]MBD9559260.1 glycosyltransferase family 2 protein [Ensifer sp. ENS03]RAS13569.1 glycosyl transferase family 2 [Ensifer adhaerens]
MRVTLAICCYNAEETIERTLLSARQLDWDDLEILVCDDVSTDRSAAIVQTVSQQDSRVRLVSHSNNKGNAGARNTLAREATGEILAFLDSDDENAPERLKVQVAKLLAAEERHAAPISVYCRRRVISDGKTRSLSAMGTAQPVGGDAVALHLLCDDPLPGDGRVGTCTMLTRVSTLRKFAFDEDFRRAVDREWAVRFALEGGLIVGCEESLVTQHLSLTDAKRARQNDARRQVVQKFRSYLQGKRSYLYALTIHRPGRMFTKGHRLLFKPVTALLSCFRKRARSFP